LTYFEIANYYRALGQTDQAIPYQEKGVSLIEDATIATQNANQKAWYFTFENSRLRLDTLAQKRCYAYRSTVATLHALHRLEEANQYQ
jgi:hypothetical protein